MGFGVCITTEAKASLTRCHVRHTTAGHGVAISGGADVELQECSVTAAHLTRVVVGDAGTHAVLRGCSLASCKKHGLVVWNRGHTEAQQCIFSGNEGTGAFVLIQGELEMVQCRSERNKDTGFWAQQKAHLVLTDCSSTGNEWHGCGANRGVVEGLRVEVHGNGMCSFSFGSGASVVLEGCSCSDSGKNGIDIVDRGTQVKVRGCKLQGSGHCGVVAWQGGTGQMEGVTTAAHKKRGFWCQGKRSRLQLRNCHSAAPDAFVAVDGGVLDRQGCTPADAADVAQRQHLKDAAGSQRGERWRRMLPKLQVIDTDSLLDT